MHVGFLDIIIGRRGEVGPNFADKQQQGNTCLTKSIDIRFSGKYDVSPVSTEVDSLNNDVVGLYFWGNGQTNAALAIFGGWITGQRKA